VCRWLRFFDGPTDAASIAAIRSWNVNAVRVPLNEDCWLGINGVSAPYSGANYRAAIQSYVDLLLANGLYAIVDLHWNAPGTTMSTGQEPMADADHAPAFWTSVANTFKSTGSVILELYNEPWPDDDQDTTAAWTCWRDGGDCPSVPFPVAGMQTLVDVVRAAGATNLILLGGVEYSNALSQWAAYKPTDPLNNLAAAWHAYEGNACSTTACYDAIVDPVAQAFPIVATEVGNSSCDGAFLTTVTRWLDAHGQGYSAWTWNAWGTACASYSLITDYSGTPNGAYGTAYQAHLLSL
jgi:endoglucanase